MKKLLLTALTILSLATFAQDKEPKRKEVTFYNQKDDHTFTMKIKTKALQRRCKRLTKKGMVKLNEETNTLTVKKVRYFQAGLMEQVPISYYQNVTYTAQWK